MASESEDLRLSLSLGSSQNGFPLNLMLFPASVVPSKGQCSNDEAEEDAGAWSPVSTLSSLSGKRSERDDNEGDDDGQNSPKKLRLSKEQTMILEESFGEHNTLNPVSSLRLLAYLWLNVFRRLTLLVIDSCAETEAGVGKAAEPAAETSGSLVSKQKSKVRAKRTHLSVY